MASANFKAFDRTLRRIHMLNLVEAIAAEREAPFKASLVVNPRTGRPLPLADEVRTNAESRRHFAAA